MTNDEINALPTRVRKYIHDLETRTDPAGEVQERWALRQERDALLARVRELETGSIKAPHHASITLSLDTEQYRQRDPRERNGSMHYLVDRLLAGEEVAAEALEHYGIRVVVG